MDALIDKLFFPLKSRESSLFGKMSGLQSLKNNSSLLHNIPSEYQEKLLDSNWLSSDFYFNTCAKGSQLNLEPFFRTFNNDLFRRVRKLSPCAMQDYFHIFSSPFNMSGNTIADFNFLWKTVSLQTPKKSCNLNSKISKVSLSDQLVVPMASVALPANNKIDINVPVSGKTLPSLSRAKRPGQDLGNLDQQMAFRKAKELNKRSKKRRRRQKKSNAKVDSSHKLKMNCAVNLPSDSFSDNSKEIKHDTCDILCDFTISANSNNVQIVLPNVSSFVVTFENASDDDSDWDTSSEVDCLTDDSEFQIAGLYVARFSSTSCQLTPEKNIPCEVDLDLPQFRLKEVNQAWNESTKHWGKKPKSTTMVSFAPDDELVEILPVEMWDRKGEWEIYACERLRFKRRINELEKIVSPCLNSDHRAKVFYKLYQSVL